MQKRATYLIPPITGHIDRTEVFDKGLRYIGFDSAGNDISVDVYDCHMTLNREGKIILVEGGYLKYDDDGREFIICDRKNGIFLNFKAGDNGIFTAKYGRES